MFFDINTAGFESCSDAAVEIVTNLKSYGFVEKFSNITATIPEQTVSVTSMPPTNPLLHYKLPITATSWGANFNDPGVRQNRINALFTADQPPYGETEDLVLEASSSSVDVTLECPDSMAINGKKWRIKISSIGESQSVDYIPAPGYEGQEPVYTNGTAWNSLYGASPTRPNIRSTYGLTSGGSAESNYIAFSVPYHSDWKIKLTHTYFLPAVSVTVIVGTEINLPNDGSIVYDSVPATTTQQALAPTLIHPIGGLTAANWGNFTNTPTPNPTNPNGPALYNAVNPADVSKYFYSSYFTGTNALSKGRTRHYCSTTITDRGLFFAIWNTESQDTGKYFSWALIQYPVMKDSGVVRGRSLDTADSLTPVFCVFSSPADNTYFPTYGKVIVRERDIPVPSRIYRPTVVRATDGSIVSVADEEDHPSFINPHKQVCFDENGNYVATFLSDLTTRRYFYPDELDLVATVSADLVGFGQELQFTVYGEEEPRTYIALHANSPGNTGMRLLVLKNNPNPPDTVAPVSEPGD